MGTCDECFRHTDILWHYPTNSSWSYCRQCYLKLLREDNIKKQIAGSKKTKQSNLAKIKLGGQ